VSNPEWQNQGVYNNLDRQNVSFDGVRVNQGEVALYVMWYEKIDVVSNKLEYWVPRTETQPIVQSNRYLIPIDINMHQLLGQINVIPRLRILSRHNGLEQSANNNQTRIDHWHREELANVWNMDSEIRVTALAYSSK